MTRCRGLFVLMLTLVCVPAVRADDIQVGLARADITPTGPIWMAGYAARNKPSEGVDLPLHAKVLALQHGKDVPHLLITADIIGFPRSVADAIAARIEKETKVPRANILLVASHTHTGPMIAGGLAIMADLNEKEAAVLQKYAETLQDKIVAAAREALDNKGPAKLSYGSAKAGFAMNRRVFRTGGVGFGANPDGLVDHQVPVLRIDAPDGKVRAIVFGYACHCTTLGGNYYRIGGDWAGFAQDFLERAHPGATALFVTGCGGDADPQPRGTIDLARQHGLEIAGAVSQALKAARTPLAEPLHAAWQTVDLPFAKLPDRDYYQKRLDDKNTWVKRHARMHVDILERGGKLPVSYPCPIQVWQFGKDLTLIALGGEVVVDYALRLKREMKDRNVWVVAYANDVFAYVPSARILIEGGYEADFNLIYYGLPTRFSNDIEEVLIKATTQLVQKTRRSGE